MLSSVIIIIAVALIVQFRLRRDPDIGLATAVFFLILLPVEVQIQIPFGLPQLTAHRVVLLVLLANLWPQVNRFSLAPVSGLVRLLCLIGLCRLASTLFTALDSAASFKVVFGYLIETVLFFVLIAAGLRSRRSVQLVAWSSVLALASVAAIGIIERYTGHNLAAVVIPGMIQNPRDVTATFRHRILFGYAMAMGFPLALALSSGSASGWLRRLAFASLFLLPAACYFGQSRGPWLGCALAGAVLSILGTQTIRRRLKLTAILAAVVLILRPGTYDTIQSLWHQSFSKDTIKGRSTDYRKVLWRVAFSELTKSSGSMLLGYGGHSTEILDLSQYFDEGAGGTTAGLGHTSWDSQFAADFMQYGFLGFGLEVILYISILHLVRQTWRASDGNNRDFAAALVAIALVFYWAMSTVAIFNPQLEYLFWTIVALAGQFHAATAAADLDLSAADSEMTPASDPISADPAAPFGQSH